MLSRSFSVPKDTVELDVIGDVSMQSGEEEGNAEDADMLNQDSVEAVTAEVPAGDGDNDSVGNEDGEEEGDEEDGSDGDESEAEPEEEEVMVPVADILNAAFGLDNVSQELPSYISADFPQAHLSFEDGRCQMYTTKRIAKGDQIVGNV
jgi:hypothetical protein